MERVEFPNPRARPAALMAVVADAASQLALSCGLAPERVALGGRSMGGRVCSMAVADGLGALGLVLVSYPLHPPGRPERARTAHFPELRVPCVFVSGTRDAFAAPAELQQATGAIPGPVTHVWIEGGDHGLRARDRQVAEAVARWLTAATGPQG